MNAAERNTAFMKAFDRADNSVHDLAAVVGSVAYALAARAPSDRREADHMQLFHWMREKLDRIEVYLDELHMAHRDTISPVQKTESGEEPR